MADMNSRTVEGLLVFSDYLKEKHFLTSNTVEGWKTAIKKVFEGVDGDAAGTVSIADLDLDAYLRRFQVAAGRGYRPETITVYGRRIRQAMEAQRQYVETGQVPTFKTGGAKGPAKSQSSGGAKAVKSSASAPVDTPLTPSTEELVEFPFPLRNGVMAKLQLPARGLDPKDADRMSAFLRTLQFEEQKQIPEKTSQDALAA